MRVWTTKCPTLSAQREVDWAVDVIVKFADEHPALAFKRSPTVKPSAAGPGHTTSTTIESRNPHRQSNCLSGYPAVTPQSPVTDSGDGYVGDLQSREGRGRTPKPPTAYRR